MGRGGKRNRGNGGWRWDNRGGGNSSNTNHSGDEQRHYYWRDGGGGPQQRSGFYDGEYYSEGNSPALSYIYRHAWSGLTSSDGGSNSIAAWQQEVQQRMSVAGDVDVFDQSSTVVAPYVRGVVAEGAIDTRSELSTNRPGSNNQLSSYSVQQNLSTVSAASVETCLRGGVDLPQTLIRPAIMEPSEGSGDLQVENTSNTQEEICGTTADPQQTFPDLVENVGMEAVRDDGQSAMVIQPSEELNNIDGHPVAAPRSRHSSAASHHSGVSCHNGVIPPRNDGVVIESEENEDENANERFQREGETQHASLSSSHYEDERHWSFILGVDDAAVDDVTAADHRKRTSSVGSASSKRSEAEIRLLNDGEVQCSEEISERISVKTASRRSSICSTQSLENGGVRLADVNSSEHDLSRRFLNTGGGERHGRIRTLSLRSMHDEQPLRACPHYVSDHQLAFRGRRNPADRSVQQHRALHTNMVQQENLLPHLKVNDEDYAGQQAIQMANLGRSSSAHSFHKSCLEEALDELSGRMDDEASNISVRASSMGSRHSIANEDPNVIALSNETFVKSDDDDVVTVNEMGETERFASVTGVNIAMSIDAAQIPSRDTEETSEIFRSRNVSVCSHRSAGIGGAEEQIANDDVITAKDATYLMHSSNSVGNMLIADNIVDENIERTSSALSSKHLYGDYRRPTQRIRTMSLRSTSDLQPVDSYRRYTSDYQLVPTISNNGTTLEKRTSSEMSGVHQVEDVKLLKQAEADSDVDGGIVTATEHTACKSRSASVVSAHIMGCNDEMEAEHGVLPHIPTLVVGDNYRAPITRTLSVRDWKGLADEQSLIGCHHYLSEGHLSSEAIHSGLHDDFGIRDKYRPNQEVEEDRSTAIANSAINGDITMTTADVEHMPHRDSMGSLHAAVSVCKQSVGHRPRSGSIGSGQSALSHHSFYCNTCDHGTVGRMNEERDICNNEVISERYSIAMKDRHSSTCGSLNEVKDNERELGMDVVEDIQGNEDVNKLLSLRTTRHSTSICSMGSENVFDKDELCGVQNDSSNIVELSADAIGKAGGQAVIDVNSEDMRTACGDMNSMDANCDKREYTSNGANMKLLLSSSRGPSAKSNGSQRTHISVLNLPIACGDRGDHIVSRPHSAAEVTLKIDNEGNLLSNTESVGSNAPTYELTKVSAVRSSISSTASADSLTRGETDSKVTAAEAPSKSYDGGHILMKESGTPLMMRGDSLLNTPSSALNRTHYSRAEFEQRKAAIIEATMQQNRDSHSARPLVYQFGSSNGSNQQQQGFSLFHHPSHPSPLCKSKKPVQNFGTESRTTSMPNDIHYQRANRTPSRNSSSEYSVRIRSDHKASVSSNSSSTRDPHIYYERVPSLKSTGYTSECPECATEMIGELRERYNMEHSLATLSDEISAIRPHVSRGQTRRLASLFENMVASVAEDAGLSNSLPSLRRNKSLPPRKASREAYQRQEMLEKRSLDDSFLNEQHPEGMKLCAKGPTQPAFEARDKRVLDWDSELAAYKGNTKNANVRSLADRFEVAMANGHNVPLKSRSIGPAAQEQTRSRFVALQHERNDSLMATSGSKHPSKSSYMKEITKGKVTGVTTGFEFTGRATSLAVKDTHLYSHSPLRHHNVGVNEVSTHDHHDELFLGEGNSSPFWRANDSSSVIEKRTDSRIRRLQEADKLLKDERLVTHQVADSTKVKGIRGPTFDAVDKGALLHGDHDLSSVSMSTIGEMNDDAEYALRIKGIQEAIRAQENRVSEVVNSVAAFGKNNVRKFAKIYVQRELLLCRERRWNLLNELKRVEALKAIKKRTPQLSPTVESTFDVHSISVQLCEGFCRRSIDEKDSYAFVALLKSNEQAYATDAVSLIDSGVGIVRFSNHIHFDALPVDFAVTIDIYAMKIPEMRRGADPFSARTSHKVNDTNLSHYHSKKSTFDIPLLKLCECWRCGIVVMNRNNVRVKRLSLDSVEYPLEDGIEIKSHCSTLPPILAINFGGFLNMMETVVGETSWTRYWAVLHRGTVSFWMHPDEQASDKLAIACLDLTKCINKKITPTAYKNKSLNMFVLDMLIDSASCVIEEKRVVLSADTEEFCIAWTQAINETLGILRA